MADRFDLGSYNGLYDGFEEDRDWLRGEVSNADELFRECCEEIASTKEWLNREEEHIAWKVMRILVTNFKAKAID